MNSSTPQESSDFSMQPAASQPDLLHSSQKKGGCAYAVIYTLLLIWVTVISLLASLVTWILEQANFSGEIPISPLPWTTFTLLISALLIGAPCLVAALIIKMPVQRAPMRTWALAGLFVFCLVPSHLTDIVDFQLAMLLKLAGMLLYLVALFIWRTISKTPLHRPQWNGVWLALAGGGLIAFPWLLNGALGSILDILLALIVSLLFGLSAALTLDLSLFSVTRPQSEVSNRRLWLDALTAVATLGIMVHSIAQSGNQSLLVISLPLAGLVVSALDAYHKQADSTRRIGAWGSAACLLSLSLFWPLAMVDPDELMAVITGGSGDLMSYGLNMTVITLGVLLVLGLVLLLVYKWLHQSTTAGRIGWPLALLVWAAMIGIYSLGGQHGFYGEQLFVILKDQADVSHAESISDTNQRRQYVYDTLVARANDSQAGLRKKLDQFGIHYTSYYLVNGLEVDGGPLLALWLKNQPEVDRVLPSPHLRPLAQALPISKGELSQTDLHGAMGEMWNLKMIGADRVVSELNVTGQGIVVGQSDSGAQGDHPELAESYRGRLQGNDYNWLDPWYHTTSPLDIGGHGTHTLGSIVGKNVGVAPGAQWIGCVNLARNLGNPPYYLNCMQFMLAPYPQNGNPLKDGDPARGAQVLNNSWGCPNVEGCDANALLPAVRALRQAGIFVVASAGNDGMQGCGSVKDPIALYGEVYSVGAVNKKGDRAEFSSLGPVNIDGSGRVKPDITAPGENVFSSTPQNTYAIYSGTSMAGPHVAGVVALMWSANPRLVGNIEQTAKILNTTAHPYTGLLPQCAQVSSTPNNVAGYGIVDAFAAVKAAQEFK